jgi:hypothetical protein
MRDAKLKQQPIASDLLQISTSLPLTSLFEVSPSRDVFAGFYIPYEGDTPSKSDYRS